MAGTDGKGVTGSEGKGVREQPGDDEQQVGGTGTFSEVRRVWAGGEDERRKARREWRDRGGEVSEGGAGKRPRGHRFEVGHWRGFIGGNKSVLGSRSGQSWVTTLCMQKNHHK